MQIPKIILPVATALVGLTLGIFFFPTLGSSSSTSRNSAESSASNPAAANSHESNERPRTKSRDRADAEPTTPQVAVTIEEMGNLMRRSVREMAFAYDLSEGGKGIAKSLKIAGAKPEEIATIDKIVKDTVERLDAAEKQHSKLGEVTEEKITIDTSGMNETIDTELANLQSEFRANLPSFMAEALIDAIDWNLAYPRGNIELSIGRSTTANEQNQQVEVLSATINRAGNSAGYHLPNSIPEDGTPIALDQLGLFDPWKHLIQGKTLTLKKRAD